jgi:hypothetical protein
VLDQQDFKHFLRDILKHGDLVKLASWFQVSEAAISQELNPNLDIPCKLYRGLKRAEAITNVNPDAGRKLRELINDLFDEWLAQEANKTPDLLLCDVAQDEAELISSRFKHLPIHEQRARAVKLQDAAARFVESLGPAEVRA